MFFSVVLLGLLFSQATTPAQAPAATLLESAKLGDLTAVRDLLSRRAPVDAADRRGLTPLMWAAAGGNIEVVRQLLDSGAAVDRRADDGTDRADARVGQRFHRTSCARWCSRAPTSPPREAG